MGTTPLFSFLEMHPSTSSQNQRSAILPLRSKMEQATACGSLRFSKQFRTKFCSKSHSLIYLRFLSNQKFPIRNQGPFSSVATQRATAYLGRVTIHCFQAYSCGAVLWLHFAFPYQQLQVSC